MEDTLTIPEQEVQTEAPPQETPPSKRLYDKLSEKGLYSKTYDEFKTQFSNPESVKKLHTALVGKNMYSKSADDFQTQFFSEKKNEVESTPLPSKSSAIPLPSPAPKTKG